jgi:hypothetical protein
MHEFRVDSDELGAGTEPKSRSMAIQLPRRLVERAADLHLVLIPPRRELASCRLP